jgi:methylase of polypeptide subunit release factors
MPRISHGLIRVASRQHARLPNLLRACRDLNSARLELKWIEEHVDAQKSWSHDRKQKKLYELCQARGRGVPLQYLLGSEYFGPLEIKCRPGVLIPRPATADAVLKLLELLRSGGTNLPGTLRVLDLCSGSGCISLLFAHSFPYRETAVQDIELCAVDISLNAISLAEENRSRVLRSLQESTDSSNLFAETTIRNIRFHSGDIFTIPDRMSLDYQSQEDGVVARHNWDIIISNPPYISPTSFRTMTSRSVRSYEPKLALVPQTRLQMQDEQQGDLFYPHLFQLAEIYDTKLVVFEVGDMLQAERVARLAQTYKRWVGIEIWRDDPREEADRTILNERGLSDINIVGEGDGRSVICWNLDAISWVGKNATDRKSEPFMKSNTTGIANPS